ncbi:MAG: ATP-binding cassette domain-containing protein [Chloroflexi bacterium]|nr:ATP-binding cassette domain-containing protein [Chloroflexota bacterium]
MHPAELRYRCQLDSTSRSLMRTAMSQMQLSARAYHRLLKPPCRRLRRCCQSMPAGYQTEVGECGAMLNQGQRQLISIARAILADPRILILDETTASVVIRTEALIQQALDHLLEGRTSFVIAHRLSTVRNADMILAMDEGRSVERSTHKELLDNDALYADLYRRKFYAPLGTRGWGAGSRKQEA